MKYHDSEMILEPGPFACGFTGARGALCPDGIRRNAHPTYDGIADTFFSVPMFVYAKGKRVYGYVTVQTLQGFDTPTPDDPATVYFRPYTYRANHELVES